MIEQELLLLGLLRENPKHGYEIKKEIRKILSLFAGLDLKSIYYPLRILEQKGLIGERALKSGRRPQRRVYYLTSKGAERFAQLLSKSFLNFKRPQFSLDLSLYFLSYIDSKVAKRRLRARMQILRGLSKGLNEMVASLKKKPSSLVFMLEHNLHMLDAECQFLSSFIKRI